ncbi:MAG: response regulator [Bacteroidota bacterium]|nr:response regulator [Bacteroidota bacterium]
MRVLIVDTSIAIIQRLKDLISPLEFIQDVDMALSYEDAKAGFSSALPEAVLLDMELPAKKSFDFLSELKASDLGILVIAMAGTAVEGLKEKSLALGARYFIDKYSEFEKVPKLLGDIYLHKKEVGFSK